MAQEEPMQIEYRGVPIDAADLKSALDEVQDELGNTDGRAARVGNVYVEGDGDPDSYVRVGQFGGDGVEALSPSGIIRVESLRNRIEDAREEHADGLSFVEFLIEEVGIEACNDFEDDPEGLRSALHDAEVEYIYFRSDEMENLDDHDSVGIRKIDSFEDEDGNTRIRVGLVDLRDDDE